MRIISALFVVVFLAIQLQAAVYTVTTTADEGPGSLRQAILDANLTPVADIINFDIPGNGVLTIAPLSPLPTITNTITINGYSQPGSKVNSLPWGNDALLRIRLDGVNLTNGFPSGLHLIANLSTVRGLILVRFSYGIKIERGSGNLIVGNWVGLDWDNIARGNGFGGIVVTTTVFTPAMNNVIGGASPADRNLISGNWVGVSFSPTPAANSIVRGNFIGTDASGRLPRGNQFAGVEIQSATNIWIIGNVLSASTAAGGDGISIQGGGYHLIQENIIGQGAEPFRDLGNSADGIFVQGSTKITIGGTNGSLGNYIGFNHGNGIHLQGCTEMHVQGNRIGTAGSGAETFGNWLAGLHLNGSSTNRIIGNDIFYNGQQGVKVSAGGTANEISGNSIYDNGFLGIDLGTTGIDVNDPGDIDTGDNQLQNFPEIKEASLASGTFRAQALLDSSPSTLYRIQFYASDPWDSLLNPEGRWFIGETNVTTDPVGQASIDFARSFPSTAPELLATAIAIDPAGNTSEFSAGLPVVITPEMPTLSVVADNTHITVSWLASAVGFELESAMTLSPSDWQAATNTVIDGGAYKLVLMPKAQPPAQQFFRLRKAL